MVNWHWNPQPDIQSLLDTIARRGKPGRVHKLELWTDYEIMAALLGKPAPPDLPGRAESRALADFKIEYYFTFGYDAFWEGPFLSFPRSRDLLSDDTAALPHSKRKWVSETQGEITSWQDFDHYHWPRLEEINFDRFEYTLSRLPEGMGLFAGVPGVFESLSFLMGYETLCMALFDQPELVQAVLDQVRALILPLAETLVSYDRVAGLWIGDDMGFKTGTLVSPKHLRCYVFPLLGELAQASHRREKPFLLHSCGKLNAVMPDLIHQVGIDAKHSFEDVIQPVEAFAAEYGQEVCVIGGIDIDLLSRGTEEAVRQRTRQVLEACLPRNGYILGSGNTVTNYILPANFLAMLDEGQRFSLNG